MTFTLGTNAEMFRDYTPALRALERSFKRAGLGISFQGFDCPPTGKKILIRYQGQFVKTVTIEGDSPAQALKDIARAVDCDWAAQKCTRGAA
jgi:hypothetical protein